MLPDSSGHFGIYGGKFVPETLMPALTELEEVYSKAKADPAFKKELEYYLTKYVGRPTPLYFAERLTKRMGKDRVIAETGAGQHGVATATVAAMFGLECEIYMGTEDMARQSLNVFRMKLLGAKVTPVDHGSRTLKDAINEAMRDWTTHVRTTHYVLGSVLGAHPYPMMVRDFQSVIGREAREQIFEAEGRLPDCLVACVGGGSNAIGLFYPFMDDPGVRMVGVEAGGLGIKTGKHAARFTTGSAGVFQGTKTYLLQDRDGQIKVI